MPYKRTQKNILFVNMFKSNFIALSRVRSLSKRIWWKYKHLIIVKFQSDCEAIDDGESYLTSIDGAVVQGRHRLHFLKIC